MHSLHFSSGAKTPLGNKGPLLSGAQSPDDIYVDENAQLFSEPEDKGNYTRIFGLFLLMAAWTLVLTFVPVFVDVGPYDIYEVIDRATDIPLRCLPYIRIDSHVPIGTQETT